MRSFGARCDMALYRVKVSNYEYGVKEREYTEQASSVSAAVSRAVRKWKAEKVTGKKRVKEIVIKVVKV